MYALASVARSTLVPKGSFVVSEGETGEVGGGKSRGKTMGKPCPDAPCMEYLPTFGPFLG